MLLLFTPSPIVEAVGTSAGSSTASGVSGIVVPPSTIVIIDWPVELPTYPLVEGYKERFPQSIARSSIQGLGLNQRTRSRSSAQAFSLSLELNNFQIGIFQTFFRTTTYGGALPFNITHPRTGDTVTMRFVGGQPPQLGRCLGFNLYQYNLNLEVMP